MNQRAAIIYAVILIPGVSYLAYAGYMGKLTANNIFHATIFGIMMGLLVKYRMEITDLKKKLEKK